MNQIECKNLFDYKDGGLYWKNDRGNNAKAGNRAGRLLKTGYRSIHVSGRKHQEHRLVFLWWHGVFPDQVDHINRMKDDNRIENLRRANHSTNQANTCGRESLTGVRGVRYRDDRGYWVARVVKDGKEIYLGSFDTLEKASSAYRSKFKELFGEFAP